MKFKVNNIPETYPRLSGNKFGRYLSEEFISEYESLLKERYDKKEEIEIVFPDFLEKVAPSIPTSFISEIEHKFPGIVKLLIFNGKESIKKSFEEECAKYE